MEYYDSTRNRQAFEFFSRKNSRILINEEVLKVLDQIDHKDISIEQTHLIELLKEDDILNKVNGTRKKRSSSSENPIRLRKSSNEESDIRDHSTNMNSTSMNTYSKLGYNSDSNRECDHEGCNDKDYQSRRKLHVNILNPAGRKGGSPGDCELPP